MTFEIAKHYFNIFAISIFEPWDANGFLQLRQRDKETREALSFYVATLGGIWDKGKYQRVFEIDSAGNVTPAKLNAEIPGSWQRVIRRPGCRYITAYSIREALQSKG